MTKAYRIYCDNCASADGICASCTGNLKQLRQERLAMLEEKEGLANKKAGNEEDDLDDEEDQDVDMAYDRDESIGEQDEHNDANEKEMDTEIDTQDGEHLNEDNSQTAGIAFLQANFASDRNLRIIENYGATKTELLVLVPKRIRKSRLSFTCLNNLEKEKRHEVGWYYSILLQYHNTEPQSIRNWL